MKQFLIAIDQVLNTLIWLKCDGFGYADETISARSWRLRDKTSFYKLINSLFFWQNNHCRGAYNAEMQRKHMPNHYRL